MGKILRQSVLIIIVLFMLIFFSCTERKEPRVLQYNIDSVVLAQRNYLTESKARLIKHIVLEGKSDSTTTILKDTTAWNNELDIFRSLNVINKPINRDAYTEEDSPDSKSNLRVRWFTSTEKLPLKYLKIYYYESFLKLRRIEALYEEENSLYKSSRTLMMEFQDVGNNNVLTSYSINGGQKMFLGDSVQFSIEGKITIN